MQTAFLRYNSYMAGNTALPKLKETKMATTSKVVNYTPEQTASIVEAYQNGTTVTDIAASVGKSVRSIVAKLSREKVYKAKEYATKTGEAVVKKDTLADKIGAVASLTEPEIESLTKANKTALKKILDLLPKAE